jgi:hypothetical protein
MKKILFLVSFVVLAAACASEPPTNTGTAANANTATSSTAGISEADVTAKEKGVWEALKKKDYEALTNMLAADYIEVEDDGVYDKAGTSNTIKDFALTDATFSDWKIIPINKDAVLVTYNLNLVSATYKTIAVPPGPYRVASAWVNRDGKWLEGFYQETLATKGPATTTPAASPAATVAKSGASPAAEPITSSDPVANEKLVWDSIKSKNAEAFAALLAPDAIEVEPAGVYDKAASAKGVTMFDASRTSLSDWKTAKLDTDATLVTYLITTPGMKPDKERHSTIWVNRNGKWMALFHQGTPVAPPANPAAK